MEAIHLTLRLLFFVWVLFLPQFLGVLVYVRLKRFPLLGQFVGILTTTILSFYFLCLVFIPKVEPEEHLCGTASFFMVTFVFFFTLFQFFLSLLTQIYLYFRNR